MDVRQRLISCKKCEKRSFDTKIGVVCSLTNAKPDFESHCTEFILDPVEEQKLAVKANYNSVYAEEDKKSNNYSIWAILGAILIIIKIIISFSR